MPQYCLVKHRIENVTIDGADADRNPDRNPVTGMVTFTPLLGKGDAVVITENGEKTTLTLAPIEARITNGELWHRGEPGVKLFAGGPDSNPERIRYRAQFTNLIGGGRKVELKDTVFEAAPGGEMELSTVQPAPAQPYPGYTPSMEAAISEISAVRDSSIDYATTKIGEYRDEALDEADLAIQAAKDANTVPRVTALEAMNGLSPESPVDGQTANLIYQEGTLTRDAVDTVVAPAMPPVYLDSYAWFGGENMYVPDQRTEETTLTASVVAGASTLTVADATGITPGVVLSIGRQSANQQLLRVASVSGSTITITGTITAGFATGTLVSPMWRNEAHLTSAGYHTMAYWMANHGDFPDVAGKKVTLLGNSWFMNIQAWGTHIQGRFPTATVVNVGVSGDTSKKMLDRFDMDVPADSDYVIINEPSTNDSYYLDPVVSLAYLGELLKKIKSIGAKAVVVGPAPLLFFPDKSADLARRVKAFVHGNMAGALSMDTNTTSVRVGNAAQAAIPTGEGNTAVGSSAQKKVAAGRWNTAVGLQSQENLVTGDRNTAIGLWSQRVLNSGSGNNTSIGARSSTALTTGYDNTHIGQNVASKTTTAGRQVIIGSSADLSTTDQSNSVVIIGYAAKAGGAGHFGVAIGANTVSEGGGAVAIGTDNLGNGAQALVANHIVLGTPAHRLRVPGLPTTAPAAGSGILWNDAGVVKVA